MLTDYYKQELRLLKDIAADFSRENPSLSSAVAGTSSDPDASRILEGVAFLTANIRQELDTQFPKLLHSLAQLVCPQYIRPMPSATIVTFEPKASLAGEITVAAGTYIDSKETEQGSCRFKTTDDIALLPMKLSQVIEYEQGSEPQVCIGLKFDLINQTLDQLPFDKVRLYLGGEYSDASDLYMLLLNHLSHVNVVSNGEVHLEPNVVQATGFEREQSLFPQPKGMMPAFDLLQQYFLFPQKYLFIDVDLSAWRARGSGASFEIKFTCEKPSFRLPRLTREHFVLHATPAVNLFELESQSVLIDASSDEYQILPNVGSSVTPTQIYSVDHVESFARGMERAREYQLFGGFYQPELEQSVYEMQYRTGARADNPDLFLKLAFPANEQIGKREILKAKLTCSNGRAPEKLMPGEICVATSNTPELATFRNLTSPTTARRIPIDGDMLWQLISHLSLNYLSITDAKTLNAILRQYIAPDSRDKSSRLSNEKKIDAITDVVVTPGESLFGNAFIHGQNIRVVVKTENFQCAGDKYVFGSVLDRFFAGTAAINVYSELTFEDFFSGERLSWPAKIGNRPLQ